MAVKGGKGKGRRKPPDAKAAARINAKRKAGFEAQGARVDVHGRGTDAVGTGSAAMAETKRSSEEARHETCFECGYSGGRHASVCSRRAL